MTVLRLVCLAAFGFCLSCGQGLTTNLEDLRQLHEYSDILRSENPDLEKLFDQAGLTSVTKEFGPTIIQTKKLPFRSDLAQASIKPWSAWWHPKRETDLFTDAEGKYSSPLTKYDILGQKENELKKLPSPISAAEFERAAYNPQALVWEGLCDAWALASISQPEPRNPVNVQKKKISLVFSVGDLKALLLKTFEAVDDSNLKYYGQKFTGDYTAWINPDIFPDQFHRFLEIQLFERKLPFIMDHDAGVEVWNVPVYKTNYTLNLVPGDPNAVAVQTWVYSVEPTKANQRDFVGTIETIREYNYILKGIRNTEGDLIVQSGYWVVGPSGVNSRKDHPDYVMVISNPNGLTRKSWNRGIDIKFIDEILSKSY